MVPSGRPAAAVAARDLGSEQGADRAVDVADRHRDLDGHGVVEGRAAGLDEGSVEGPVEAVVLGPDPVSGRVGLGLGPDQDRRQVQTVRLPVADGAW